MIKDTILKLRPPRIAMSLMAVAGLFYWLVPVARLSLFSCPGCGLVALGSGFGVMMWAWGMFQREKNPICPTATARTLIRSGPFRFTRNPMYLGMILMLLWPFLWTGCPVFLFPPTAFFGIIHNFFIPYEENSLGHSFSEDYAAYKGMVRRWI